MKKYDVVAFGEMLVDLSLSGVSGQGNELWEANPGGAPCNVLAMLNKLGKKTIFIGKVGDDHFGHLLENTLIDVGIDSSGLLFDENFNTTLAIVSIFEDGERDFAFYRKPGADMCITEKEVDENIIANARVFHFGTLSLTNEPAKSATHRAIDLAKKHNLLITYDPNLRPPLWENLNIAKLQMEWGAKQCNVMKASEKEIMFLSGCRNVEEAVNYVKYKYPNIKLLLVTKGKNGSICYYKNLKIVSPAVLNVKTIDTTGAGDTFMGSIINFVLKYGIDNLTKEQLTSILLFSSAAAALVTTKKGAIKSMPTMKEVENLIMENFKNI